MGKLTGLKFVFTGTSFLPRKELEEIVSDNGGIYGSSITNSTDYLVVGENPGSKFDKAKKLGIKTIDAEYLINKLIKGTKTKKIVKEEIIEEKIEEIKNHACKNFDFLDI